MSNLTNNAAQGNIALGNTDETRRCGSCQVTKPLIEFTRSLKANGPIEGYFKSCNNCEYRCINRSNPAARPTRKQFECMFILRDDEQEADLEGQPGAATDDQEEPTLQQMVDDMAKYI
ncbi:hypothetical protein IMZ48_38355 [Candidatus Bathyarchaeota archaeon]|nr:hypothetical protein [Candidatus Bathyarchaeota archaeon]